MPDIFKRITKWGTVSVERRDGEPRIKIEGFEAEGMNAGEVAFYAVITAKQALDKALDLDPLQLKKNKEWLASAGIVE